MLFAEGSASESISNGLVLGLLAANVAVLVAILVVAALLQSRLAFVDTTRLSIEETDLQNRIGHVMAIATLQIAFSTAVSVLALVALVWRSIPMQLTTLSLTGLDIILFAVLSYASIRTLSNLRTTP